MMKFKFIIITVILLIPVLSAFSQESILSLHYGTSIPLGETKEFIDRTSWRNFSCTFEKYRDSATSVGIEVGLNIFHQKKYGKVRLSGTADAFGTNLNYLNIAPVAAVGHKYYRKTNAIIFAGGSIGSAWVERSTEIGSFSSSENIWPAYFSPDAGLMFPLGDRGEVILKAKYSLFYSLDSDITEQLFSLSFGLGWE